MYFHPWGECKRAGCAGLGGVDSGKVIWVGKASRQSAWIVADVLKKCFELAFMRENSVVVAMGEEGLSHVWLFTGHGGCIIELCAIYFGASDF